MNEDLLGAMEQMASLIRIRVAGCLAEPEVMVNLEDLRDMIGMLGYMVVINAERKQDEGLESREDAAQARVLNIFATVTDLVRARAEMELI